MIQPVVTLENYRVRLRDLFPRAELEDEALEELDSAECCDL